MTATAHPTANAFNWLAKHQLEVAVSRAAAAHATGRLIDIGCGEKPYREMFSLYVNEHVGVDHPNSPHALASVDVLADAYMIPLADRSFDTAFLGEVLEHLERPADALAETFRLLKPGGKIILTSPFAWPLHEMPRDFYRYAPGGLRHLLAGAGFGEVVVTPLSGQWSTLALLGGYALRQSPARRLKRTLPRFASFGQSVAQRLDARWPEAWLSWNHLAVATRPAPDVAVQQRAGQTELGSAAWD